MIASGTLNEDDRPDYADAIHEIERSALPAKKPVNRDECRLDIAEAVDAYLSKSSCKREKSSKGAVFNAPIVGAPRAKRLKGSAKRITALISECDLLLNSPRYIDPLIWALDSDSDQHDWEGASRYISELQSTLRSYAVWFQRGAEIAHNEIPGRGNRGSMERDFVCLLICLFKDHTGRMLPKNASKDDYEVGDERYTGPIVRFVKAVITGTPHLRASPTKWGAMVEQCLEDLGEDPDTEDHIALRASRRLRLALKHGLSDVGK
jgi:hypothetical protein